MGRNLSRPPLSAQEQLEICEWYLSGEGLVDIGRKYGISRSPVKTTLLVHGVELRPSGGKFKGGRFLDKKGYASNSSPSRGFESVTYRCP